jgi:hypothetical protein
MTLYLALLTYRLPVWRAPDPHEAQQELAYYFEQALLLPVKEAEA